MHKYLKIIMMWQGTHTYTEGLEYTFCRGRNHVHHHVFHVHEKEPLNNLWPNDLKIIFKRINQSNKKLHFVPVSPQWKHSLVPGLCPPLAHSTMNAAYTH